MNCYTASQYHDLKSKVLSLPSEIAPFSPGSKYDNFEESHELARIRALHTAREIVRALEKPEEVIIRYAFMVLAFPSRNAYLFVNRALTPHSW